VGEYFGAAFGPSNVKRDHDLYMPDTYWRGPAWMPLNYFFSLCMRRWGLIAEANTLVKQSAAALRTSGWAEYWNPESGVGYGAQPQSWNALIVAMLDQ
jgi:glycogen debranching enzyme